MSNIDFYHNYSKCTYGIVRSEISPLIPRDFMRFATAFCKKSTTKFTLLSLSSFLVERVFLLMKRIFFLVLAVWLFNLFVHWDQCFVGKTTYCWDSIWSENLLMTMSIYFCIWPSFTRLLKILNHYALRYLPDIFMMVCDYKHSLKDFAYYGFVTRIWVNS